MTSPASDIVEHISGCIQLATLLEVSAYPKPGNVHRTANFDNTRYEHFLASSIAIGSSLRNASHRGIEVSSGRIRLDEVGVGFIIRDGASSMIKWQHGGNTILGSILLLIPMSVAGGYVWSQPSPSIESLRHILSKVIRATTVQDAIQVYEAIRLSRAGGLGTVEKLDVATDTYRGEIEKAGASLSEVFRLSSGYDSIASEWANDFKITFDIGYPYFVSQLQETNDYNAATVHTFLRILSMIPDTLISRKVGDEQAKEISGSAGEVLSLGGLATDLGREKLALLDNRLRNDGHQLNPGTTADLTASSLALAILDGHLP